MLDGEQTNRTLLQCLALAVLLTAAAMTAWPADVARAQDTGGPSADPVAEDAVGEVAAEPASDDDAGAASPELEGINVFHLLVQGGYFMLPIVLMSLVVVTFAIERLLGLRKARVLPDGMVAALGKLGGPQGGFDPRQAYRVCQQFPSAASTVVRAMLLKVGRPHSEVEHAVAEASEREAARLYANVRWLNLAATVTPLLGLLGTVWGMIRAFHDTTQLAPGQNKADYLAEGIYIALVTTLSGLSVAIPAAILSHFFEGRIQNLFHQIDELLFNLMPQVERFEGRVRFSRNVAPGDGSPRESTLEPPVQAPS
jgi:biopolymer transport protein ExbB